MFKRILSVLLLTFTAVQVRAVSYTVLWSDQQAFSCRVDVPAPDVRSERTDDGVFTRIGMEGFGTAGADTGAPQVPCAPLFVGVPWTGNAAVTVRPVFRDGIRVPAPLLPVPVVTGAGLERHERYRPDPAVYGAGRTYPERTYRVCTETFRFQRMVRIDLLPVAYDPARGLVRHVSAYDVSVVFPPGAGISRDDRHFEPVYKSTLANYDAARLWRRPRPAAALAKAGAAAVTGAGEWYKIKVVDEGMYRITASQLSAAGLSGVTGAGLRLYTGSGRMLDEGALPDSMTQPRDTLREVAVYVSTDGTFDDDAYLLFYGTGPAGWEYDTAAASWDYYKNHFATENIYWLTVDYGAAGRRMDTLIQPAGTVDTVVRVGGRAHYEQELVFDYDEFNEHPMLADYRDWGWKMIDGDAWETMSGGFALPGLVSGSVAAYRIRLANGSASEAELRCNGTSLGTRTLGVLSGTSAVFTGTGNLLEAKSESNLLDWFEVTYARSLEGDAGGISFAHDTSAAAVYRASGLAASEYWVFDVSDPYAVSYARARAQDGDLTVGRNRSGYIDVRIVRDGTWQSPAAVARNNAEDLTGALNADYVMIAPAAFADMAGELADFHTSRAEVNGILNAKVVLLDDIYDNFSAGRTEPAAIREFLAFAFDTWTEPPAYAVLVGDGHYDFKHIQADPDNENQRNWMPVYLSSSGTCSDDWFVSRNWSGSTASNRLMCVGRLPVRSTSELGVMIDKVVTYESGRTVGTGWRNRVVLMADDEYNPEYSGGYEAQFYHVEQAENLAVCVPEMYSIYKLYLIDYERDMQGMKPDAADEFIRQFNQGALLFNYTGHGAPDILAHESAFRFSSDHEQIDNGARMPVFTAFSCAVGQFDNYARLSIAEGLLLLADGGSIASIAATEATYIGNNEYVSSAVYNEYFNSGCVTLGQAFVAAKRTAYSAWNTARSYHLFGDPALSIARPAYQITIDDLTPDSLKALALTAVSCSVRDTDSTVAAVFGGDAYVEVFDAEQLKTYTHAFDASRQITYALQGGCLFRGQAAVSDGAFSFNFMVPKDISYQQAGGKIIAFAAGDAGEGFGALKGIYLGGTATSGTDDTRGPTITLALKNYREQDYGRVSTAPVLTIALEDVSGINTAGAVGHGITLTLDNDPTTALDMTGSFTYDKGSHTRGSLEYALFNLAAGGHVFAVKAWDSYNNSSEEELAFTVVSGRDISVTNPLNYPNPFMPDRGDGKGGTTITYVLSQAAEEKASVRVYTVSGRFVRELDGGTSMGYNTVYWDGRDAHGRPLANGTYLYVVSAATSYEDGLKVKKTKDRARGYAVIMR